jgi:hypothetical protein
MTFIKKQLVVTSVDKDTPLHAMKLQEWLDLVAFLYHTLTQVGVYYLRGVVVVKPGACS